METFYTQDSANSPSMLKVFALSSRNTLELLQYQVVEPNIEIIQPQLIAAASLILNRIGATLNLKGREVSELRFLKNEEDAHNVLRIVLENIIVSSSGFSSIYETYGIIVLPSEIDISLIQY